MQRLLLALIAVMSLVSVALRPAQAQNDTGKPVEPTSSPQRVDEHVSKSFDTAHSAGSAAQRDAGSSDASPPGAAGAGSQGDMPETVNRDETLENLRVQDRPLVIEGNVKHDVIAVRSDVTVQPGARVGGHLVMVGGNLENRSGKGLRVVKLDPGLASAFGAGAFAALPREITPPATPEPARRNAGSWFWAQLGLLVFGLIGGLIMLVVAPRAAHQAASRIDLEPGRCLIVGGIGTLIGLAILTLNAAIMKSAVGLLYAPLGAIVALAPLVLLAYGWLCGMRFVGNIVAHRLGRNDSGALFARIALGLGAFCLLNLLLGRTLGVATLTLEFVVALMGLGAVLTTGGGADPDWLDARLRGQARWFSFGRRW